MVNSRTYTVNWWSIVEHIQLTGGQ